MTLPPSLERHAPLLLVLILTGWFHGSSMTRHGLRGEEARRGLVAQEMIRSGDWLVPREQGQVFLSRPPLQNWIIAAVGIARGRVDAVAIRLPSVVAILLTVAMLYVIAKQYLSTAAAALAGLSYATMLQVLELGGSGETESMHTLIVAGSILSWHHFWSRDRLMVAWTLGFALAGLAMLAKGPQGPIYFMATAGMMVVATKKWKQVLQPAPWVGLVVFLLVWGAWNVPFTLQFGLETSWAMLGNDVALRFVPPTLSERLMHLVAFPGEIFVCWMPWSMLMPLLLWRRCRQSMANVEGFSSLMLLSIVAIAVTFPSVWFVTGAKSRYFLPLAPMGALLAAGGTEACWRMGVGRWASLASSWRRMVVGFAALAIAACIAIPIVSHHNPQLGLSTPRALVVGLIMLGLAVVLMICASRPIHPQYHTVTVVAAASVLGVIHTMVAIPMIAHHSHRADVSVAKLKSDLPAGGRLYSSGLVDAVFVLHYDAPLPLLADDQPLGVTDAVCYDGKTWPAGLNRQQWTRVADIRCDRNIQSAPDRQVVVLRRRY